jgi:glyoxylase-like metal-dependent hydrolase (beta-lactamase superfamily II)
MRKPVLWLSLGLAAAFSACDGGGPGPGPDPVCGNGVLEDGEECDGGAGCDGLCKITAVNIACPRLTELSRVCVPLPGSGNVVQIRGADEDCDAGFFSTQRVDVRELFEDTILIKEVGDPTTEDPVLTLFLGEGKALLLDSGNNVDYDGGAGVLGPNDLVAELIGDRSLELINTHLHGDHLGDNNNFDDITVMSIGSTDSFCAVDAADFDANQTATCNNAGTFGGFQIDRVIRDGHEIDLGGGRVITVLSAPGHTASSNLLVDPTHRLLFTGDTIYPGNNPPILHGGDSDFREYLDTARQMATFESSTDIVIGAHGQGVMPSRVLGSFLDLVEARNVDPNSPDTFVDPEGCDSGDFTFLNFPN